MNPCLSQEDRQQLEAGYQAARDKRTANRINILLLLDYGYTFKVVAAILRLDDETIRRQENAYRALGLAEYIKSPFAGGTCKLTVERPYDDNFCVRLAQNILKRVLRFLRLFLRLP